VCATVTGSMTTVTGCAAGVLTEILELRVSPWLLNEATW
jgi:hypothetical protein